MRPYPRAATRLSFRSGRHASALVGGDTSAFAVAENKLIDHETATAVHHQTGQPLAGWFQLQAMHAEILAEQPDLLD